MITLKKKIKKYKVQKNLMEFKVYTILDVQVGGKSVLNPGKSPEPGDAQVPQKQRVKLEPKPIRKESAQTLQSSEHQVPGTETTSNERVRRSSRQEETKRLQEPGGQPGEETVQQ